MRAAWGFLVVSAFVVSSLVHAVGQAQVFPQERWDRSLDVAADVAYDVAVVPDGGAVVVGTSGVIKYSIDGSLLWKGNYPGVAYGVTVDRGGHIYVAGDAGLSCFGPQGEQLWAAEGDFRDVALGSGGSLLALGMNRIAVFSASGEKLANIELPYSGKAKLIAASAEGLVVGGTAGVMLFDIANDAIVWTAPAWGELQDVAVDPEGNIYAIGSQGIRAFTPKGRLLWEIPLSNEAFAGSFYSGPEGPWLVVVEKGAGGNLVLEAYTPGEGKAVWSLLGAAKGWKTLSVHAMAADSKSGTFYVVGARQEEKGGGSDYLTAQYVLAQPGEVKAPPEEVCDIRAAFSISPASPLSGDEVGFINESTGDIVVCSWDFGDGTGSSEWEPVHVYPVPGVYTVSLTVMDAKGCQDVARKQLVVGDRPPVVEGFDYEIVPRADFTWTVDHEAHGTYPMDFIPEGATDIDDICFRDLSSGTEVTLRAKASDPDGEIVTYKWDLDFDGVFDAEGEEVTWDFEEPGVYPVTLVAVDDRGAEGRYDGFVDTEMIAVISWDWEFGDGGSSDEQNPTHWFQDDGTYEVSLTVWDEAGNSDSVTKEIVVGNVPPVAEFNYAVLPGTVQLKADFDWDIEREQHGSYPEGFEPEEPTDIDNILFQDASVSEYRPAKVSFSAVGCSDVDGEVVRYEWDFDGDGEVDAEGEEVEWKPLESGTYHVALTVTDDDGGKNVYKEDIEVEVVEGGEIVAWEWEFGDGGSSDEQNPTHWFQDDGTYEVSLTVWDEAGNSDSVTKEIAVGNVPPVADFIWSFEQPEDFLPSCEDLLPGGEPMPAATSTVPGCGLVLATTTSVVGPGNGGVVCQKPEVPDDAGVVAFEDLSQDGEPWHELVARQWQWSLDGYAECWEEEGCEDSLNPEIVFLWDRDGETFLYRGEVEVTLQETDDDGATSEVTKTVNIANIAPYAAFEWYQGEYQPELDCDSCEATYGSGDPVKTANNGSVTVTRTVYSWDCGEEEASAILAPWGGAGVELEITGTGTVDLTETIPEGWEYDDPWGDGCVTITEQGDGFWSATVNLDACEEGVAHIYYDLYPPEGAVDPGIYTIRGTFDGTSIDIDSDVVLCTSVDVHDVYVYFHGYGWDEMWMADPNGDDIISWEWEFGGFGTASGQDPSGDCCDSGECFLGTLENVSCEYDEDRGEWIWSYDFPVSLTVTDEAGGATTVETEIHLEGPCEGGAPE